MKIESMQVNHLSKPIGIGAEDLTFSFKISGYGSLESITAEFSADADFKTVFCRETENIEPFGFSPCCVFRGGKRYFWRISALGANGETATASSFFECGRENSVWDIPFITTRKENRVSAAFIRKFTIREIKNARLYITALGMYEAYLNGKKIGREYFTPFCDDYRYLLQYQTYDITGDLRVGENVIAVLLGNGWYGERHPAGKCGDGAFGNGFYLSAEVTVGGERLLISDESWTEVRSPVVFSEIYDGEIYDARKEFFLPDGRVKQDAFTGENAVFTENPAGKIIPRISPELCERESFLPSLIVTPSGAQVLDFGKEITGWVEFTAIIPPGGEVKLLYGEIMQNGELYRENLRTAKAEFIAVGDGTEKTYRSHFTFFGFRYVQAEGISLTEETAKNFVGKTVYSSLKITGKIDTANEKLNRLAENVFRSQKGNFLDIPLDCPQRDERFGWTGDAQVFSETALYNADCVAFYDKYLADMREEQLRYGGACPFIVPDAFYAREERNEGRKPVSDGEFMLKRVSPGWGDAAVIIPWNLYRFTGDRGMLKKNYANMKLWADFLIRTDKNRGGKHIRDYGFRFGDWLALDNPDKEEKHGKTDEGFIATAYYYNAVRLTARAAGEIGENDDRVGYEKVAEEILAALKAEYISPDGTVKSDTQTAYALAIAFGLCDKKIAGKRLCEKLEENGGKLTTGFVGTSFLLGALAETGHGKEAYSLLLGEDLPGWLYAVNLGATTIWERWDSVLPDGTIRKGEMNSLNHYAYGSVLSWVYKSIIGIKQREDSAGFVRAVISPVIDERLGKVYGEYDSACGKYAVGYEIKGKKVVMKISVPCLGEADIIPPEGYRIEKTNGERIESGSVSLKSGEYEIVLSHMC